jgi:predicted MarR family transcription regulator
MDDDKLTEIMSDYRAAVEHNEKLEKVAIMARTYLIAALHGDLSEVEKSMHRLNEALHAVNLSVPELGKIE